MEKFLLVLQHEISFTFIGRMAAKTAGMLLCGDLPVECRQGFEWNCSSALSFHIARHKRDGWFFLIVLVSQLMKLQSVLE